MNNLSNTWITENPLFKNKNQRYYYDFGTGIKIEREEVKEEREALLNAANKTSTEPQNQKKDDFLEGFDDQNKKSTTPALSHIQGKFLDIASLTTLVHSIRKY